jgi:hypothetical protein
VCDAAAVAVRIDSSLEGIDWERAKSLVSGRWLDNDANR